MHICVSMLHGLPSSRSQESGASRSAFPGDIDIPLVEPGKLVLALLVPFTTPFQVVLVMQSTADRAAARQALRDIIPFHATAP